MEVKRKAFQGVGNIVRFNWHFYALALAILTVLPIAGTFLPITIQLFVWIGCVLATGSLFISLLVSYYVYDCSPLYSLNWVSAQQEEGLIVNISAGFDETSGLLQHKFPQARLLALDFYDPSKHTEVSIKRARKAYPPFVGTQKTTTALLPLTDDSVDKLFVILSAHEIRDEEEREVFFSELKRVLKSKGQIYVTEHLRDTANFIAYSVGFFHFYSRAAWLKTFHHVGLHVQKEKKITPFISTFVIGK